MVKQTVIVSNNCLPYRTGNNPGTYLKKKYIYKIIVHIGVDINIH